MTNTIRRAATAVACALLAAGGCASTEPPAPQASYQDPFFPEEYTRLHDLAARQQVASAARADATLYDMHFHGGRLNSLGEQKVAALMGDDDQASPVVIYLATGEAPGDGEMGAAREESIRTFAAAQAWEGFDAGSIRFERGYNPASRTPAAPHQRGLSNTDSGPSASPVSGASMSN